MKGDATMSKPDRVEQIMNHCVHFTGVQHDVCTADRLTALLEHTT